MEEKGALQVTEINVGGTSNHCSQITQFVAQDRGNRPFRMYNSSWLVKGSHHNPVRDVWDYENRNSITYQVTQKLKRVKVNTKEWARSQPPIQVQITRVAKKLNVTMFEIVEALLDQELLNRCDKEKKDLLYLID